MSRDVATDDAAAKTSSRRGSQSLNSRATKRARQVSWPSSVFALHLPLARHHLGPSKDLTSANRPRNCNGTIETAQHSLDLLLLARGSHLLRGAFHLVLALAEASILSVLLEEIRHVQRILVKRS